MQQIFLYLKLFKTVYGHLKFFGCRRLGVSYVAATTAATGTALGLNKLVAVSSLVLKYI